MFSGVLLLTGLGAAVAGRILDRRGTRPLFLAAADAGALLAASFQTRFAAFAVTYAAGCGIAGALGFYQVTQPAAARMAPAGCDWSPWSPRAKTAKPASAISPNRSA